MENLRLLCRAHNQHEADQTFGDGFMDEKRQRRSSKKEANVSKPNADPPSIDEGQTNDVIAGLRELGYRLDQARRAVASTEHLGEATLEQRMREALRFLCPRARTERPAEIHLNATT